MKQYIYVPLEFEYLMTNLFGKDQYHGYVGAVSKSAYKKDIIKLFKYIRKSITLNVDSDNYHKTKLIDICEDIEKKVKTKNDFDQLNLLAIEAFTKITFLLMGNMPSHWDIKNPYRDKNWNLSGHRTLRYNQDEDQKTALIINLADIQKKYDLGFPPDTKLPLHNIFWQQHKSNPLSFLKWFKTAFPEVYCDIF